MSHDDDRNQGTSGFSADERQALVALRTMPRPRASDAARQRALAAFLGDVTADVDKARDSGASATDRELPRQDLSRQELPRIEPRPDAGGRRWQGWALAATVVLAILAGFWYGGQPRYDWVVTDVVEADGIVAEGIEAAGDLGRGATVASGRISAGPTSELELQLGDQLRFRLLPGTSIELPPAPRRWLPGTQTIVVHTGEIYGTTGGQVLEVPLHITAQQAEARLMGTTFAVFQNDDGTCVCLWQGCITVFPRDGGESVMMEDEKKFYVFTDGSTSGLVPLDGMERMKLQMMADGGILDLEQ